MRVLGLEGRPSDVRATQLLHSFLSPQQRDTLDKYGFFYFEAPRQARNRCYAINANNPNNIIVIDSQGRPYRTRGLYISYHMPVLPAADVILTHMLYVQQHWYSFNKKACTGFYHRWDGNDLLRSGRFYGRFLASLGPQRPPGYWPPHGGLFGL